MTGHIRQRGKRSWAILLFLGRDVNGKKRYKWHTVRGTKKNAQRELTRLLNELNTGAYVEPTPLTVEEYLEKWLVGDARMSVATKSFERYEEIVQKHLVPALGSRPLTKLQPLEIQEYYSRALESGRRDGKGGLSAQTVLHHHRVLRAALRQAVRWQLLARNPADAVEPPRPRTHETYALDEKEAAQLLKASRKTRLYFPILLAVATGMRRGEILGLRWSDVDFERGVLSVCQSLEQTKAGLTFKEPKTHKSRRVIVLPPLAVEALRKRKAEQARQRLLLGPAYQESGLVCAKEDGGPITPADLSKSFAMLVRKRGVLEQPIRFHDLRHSHATQLLRQGVHPKVVSERLGHSTVGITLDTYSHVLPGLQEEAAEKVDAALRAAIRKLR